jgi:hypothetical protein
VGTRRASLPIPLLPSLLRRRRSIRRVKRAVRRALRVPKVRRRSALSLLRLSGPPTLRLRTRALCEPTRARTIKRARLRRGTTTSLGASRSARPNSANILRARATLRIRLERRLRRRGCSARAEALLVLVCVQLFAVVCCTAGEDADADAAEASAQLVRVAMRVRVVSQLRLLVRLLVLLPIQILGLTLSI